MIVYRVGDGFQDAWGRECTEDGTLLNPEMPPPANLADVEAGAADVTEDEVEEPKKKAPTKPAKKK